MRSAGQLCAGLVVLDGRSAKVVVGLPSDPILSGLSRTDTFVQIVLLVHLLAGLLLLIGYLFSDCGAGVPMGWSPSSHWLTYVQIVALVYLLAILLLLIG